MPKSILSGDEISVKGTEDLKLLDDVSSTGRKRPWKEHKLTSYRLAKSYERLGMLKKAERVLNCASIVKFKACDCGYQKLTWSNFCRVRLCSMCGWRKSLVVAHQVRRVTHEANQRENLRWIFLTLTVRNCAKEELSDVISQMMKGWQRLIQRKVVKDILVGSFRAFESTVNRDRKKPKWYGTFHPHFHVLICVRPSYFKGSKYLSKKTWANLWKESMRLDYDPVIDVRKVKPRNKELEEKIKTEMDNLYEIEKVKKIEMENAVAETAKYPVKMANVLDADESEVDESVKYLDKAIEGRRFLGYTGLLKDVWMELKEKENMKDAEDDNVDLIHVDDAPDECQCPTCNSELLEVMYTWRSGVNDFVQIPKTGKKLGRRVIDEETGEILN